MKIKKIKPFLLDRYLLVRVYTDTDIIGNGEAGLWAHQSVVFKAIKELSNYYIGKDPRLIEHHYQVISRDTHFIGSVLSAAMSAIDIALWDILGKSVDLPVHQLMGGKCRDKVKVFANIKGNSLDQLAENADQCIEQGFTSLRMTPFFPGFEKQNTTHTITTAIKMVKIVRETIGDNIDLGLEIHRNLTLEAAILFAQELTSYKILYFEDPIAPESIEALAYLAQQINLPIATGERFFNIHQFKELIDQKIVSLIRPDLSLAGGFTHCKKIAGLAEASFVGIFPHLMGSPVNNAAFTQFAASIPNYTLMESNTHDMALNRIVDNPLIPEDGYRIVPDIPGIGVEINEEILSEFEHIPKKILGSFREDGSVTH